MDTNNLSEGPHGRIYFLAGNPDLKDELWAVNWNGTSLQNLHLPVPAFYDYTAFGLNYLSRAPGGGSVAFDYDDALQANIGLITFGQ